MLFCVCAVFLRRLKIRKGPRRIRSLDKEVRHHTHTFKDLPLHSSCLAQGEYPMDLWPLSLILFV
jgi:hypothetical protein